MPACKVCGEWFAKTNPHEELCFKCECALSRLSSYATRVVRCKDCKHYRNYPNGLCYLHTEPKSNARGYSGEAVCRAGELLLLRREKRGGGVMFCWIFTRAAQMEDHEFTDDVAYCFCWTKKQAIKRFGQLYDDVKPFEVDKVVFDPFRRLPVVVTDY